MEEAFPFQDGDVACFHTAPTFVDSVWQMLGPLLAGVPCLVLPPEISRDPRALLQALVSHRVTHVVAVPTLLRMLLPHMRRLCAESELLTPAAGNCAPSPVSHDQCCLGHQGNVVKLESCSRAMQSSCSNEQPGETEATDFGGANVI